jgi:hypothetical protein
VKSGLGLVQPVSEGLAKMERSLIWVQGDADVGWACSSCRWRFPVPTLLSEEGKDAYDRLAAAKFQEHKCEAQTSSPAMKESASHTFEGRARILIKRGYKPKDAVELLLEETALESRNDPSTMKKARVEAEDFLLKISKGLI